jgi:hypothetical protein
MATSRARSALGAEAVTPATQAAAAARDGFVTYDELRGPDLDAARWSPARLPLPTGGEHIPLDPNAALAVGEGEVRVTIPRFSLSHDRFQAADSPKYLIVSTRQFGLPPDRPATLAVDLAVTNIGGEPEDYRRAMAAFQVGDLVSGRVFSVIGTATRVFALDEQLDFGGAGEPFIHVVESPYEDFDDDFTRLRGCEITLDRSSSTAAWRVDGRTVYQTHGTFIPRTRSDRIRDLDDAADPGRSQSFAGGAGHARAVAPVPCPRDRGVSRTGPPRGAHRSRARARAGAGAAAGGRGAWIVIADVAPAAVGHLRPGPPSATPDRIRHHSPARTPTTQPTAPRPSTRHDRRTCERPRTQWRSPIRACLQRSSP